MGPKVPSQGNNMHNIFTDTILVLLFWFAPYLYGYPIARLDLENVYIYIYIYIYVYVYIYIYILTKRNIFLV